MIYLITGGNSFVGIALTKLLLGEDHDVIIACRESSKCKIPVNNHLRIVRYKGLDDITTLRNSVSHADVLIHLAWGGTDHVGRNDASIQQSNIRYSMDALTLAKDLGCQLFVESGSQAEYGIINGPMTEATPCNPVTEYGKAKLEFGKKADRWCRENGIKFIHLRIVSVFGVHDHDWTLVKSCIRQMLHNEDIELSSCQQLWNYVDEDDACRQIYLLTKHAMQSQNFKSEIYLIGSYDTRCLRSFVEEMRILTHTNSHLHFGECSSNPVSLNPCMDKTASAIDSPIITKTFGEVVKQIINNEDNSLCNNVMGGGRRPALVMIEVNRPHLNVA